MEMLTVAISAETVVLCATNERMTLSAPLTSSTDESSTDGTSNLPTRFVKNGEAKVAVAKAVDDLEADLPVAREADRDLQDDAPDRVLDLAAVTEVVLEIVHETALDRETTSHENDRRIARIRARDHDRDQRAPRETRALDHVDDICRLLHHSITPAQFTPPPDCPLMKPKRPFITETNKKILSLLSAAVFDGDS